MTNGAVFLDFDSTLGKVTSETDSQMCELIASKSWSNSTDVLNSIQLFIEQNGYFSYSEFCTLYQQESLIPSLEEFFSREFQDILYSDTVDFINYAKGSGFKVFIVTQGGVDYQYAKLKYSGLLSIVDGFSILCTPNKKSVAINDIIRSHKIDIQRSLFIDDREDQILEVAQGTNIEGVRIERKKYGEPTNTVTKLIELKDKLQDLALVIEKQEVKLAIW
jgi:FMN phosphatase YigB (HAD superfamily)